MDKEQIPFLESTHLTCADVEELLDCFVEDEMISVLRERFEQHLEGCETCKELVTDTQHLVRLAPTLNDDSIPNGVRLRLRQALEEQVGHKVTYLKPRLSLVK